jgi:hypothetical protein
MTYDKSCPLWPHGEEHFYRDRRFQPAAQRPKQCVATALAILTEQPPETFVGRINTQHPVSWSDALRPWGMKLAYCPSDIRSLKYYMDERVAIDDLFDLCYYISENPEEILADPRDDGWIRGSHIVILHRELILDPSGGTQTQAFEHGCNDQHTKRIFRVVPVEHRRRI